MSDANAPTVLPADRMRRLTELSCLVSESLDVERVCDFVVRATAELLRCDLARLWLLDSAANEMRLASHATAPGLAPPQQAPRRLPVTTLIGHVAVTQRRRYSPELADDPLWRNPQWVRENGYRSQIAVPLAAGGRSIGALAVVFRRPYDFGAGEIDLLEAFAAQAAIAIRNASLFSALTASNEELERAHRQLEHLALHDPLTDLPNRVLLADRLAQALVTAHREMRACAVMVMDLDGFKQVNDEHGHHAGDAILTQAARRLKGVLRASDTLARLGGDEFAAVLPGTDRPGACATATRLVEASREPFFFDGRSLRIGASVGVVLFPDDGGDADELLRKADAAMYAAKRSKCGYAWAEAVTA